MEVTMRCEQIMKDDVECISPSDTVQTAARIMRTQNVGFLPVCDDAKKVLGTLTDRDIAIRLVADGKASDTKASEIMSTECVACRPSDDIRVAEQLMAQRQKSRIMCVDDAGCLVGVLSLSDVAQHENGTRASDTLREV